MKSLIGFVQCNTCCNLALNDLFKYCDGKKLEVKIAVKLAVEEVEKQKNFLPTLDAINKQSFGTARNVKHVF